MAWGLILLDSDNAADSEMDEYAATKESLPRERSQLWQAVLSNAKFVLVVFAACVLLTALDDWLGLSGWGALVWILVIFLVVMAGLLGFIVYLLRRIVSLLEARQAERGGD